MNISYDEHLLELGTCYDVGINDGTIFNKVLYIGSKQHNGRPMMCFKTENKEVVIINPSYNSFCMAHSNTEEGEKDNG